MAWVLPLNPDATDFSRASALAHTKVLGPFRVVQNNFQLHLFCAHLEVERGGMGGGLRGTSESVSCVLVRTPHGAPWLSGRQCWRILALAELWETTFRLFVVECPVHDDLRSCCSALPASSYEDGPSWHARLDNLSS
jgi:hypothetical protein